MGRVILLVFQSEGWSRLKALGTVAPLTATSKPGYRGFLFNPVF